MDRIAIKERSKNLLKKNHWLCVGATFLSTLALGGLASGGTSFNYNTSTDVTTDIPPATNPFVDVEPMLVISIMLFVIVALVISYVAKVFGTNQFRVGGCRFFLKYRKNNPVDIGEIFHNYKDKTFLNIAKVTFLRDLFIGLWTLLFIVPGIIKSYDYWAVNYILAVKPDTPYEKALDMSKKMMYGHRMELFELGISFFGWQLLAAFTCGILSICYVNPYAFIAETEFYSEIRQDAINRGIISPYDVPDYADYQPQSPYYPYYNPNPQQTYYNTQPMNAGYYQQPVNYPQTTPYPQEMYQQPVGAPQTYQPQPMAYGQAQFQPTVPQQPSPVTDDAFTPMQTADSPSVEMPSVPDAPKEPDTPEEL